MNKIFLIILVIFYNTIENITIVSVNFMSISLLQINYQNILMGK